MALHISFSNGITANDDMTPPVQNFLCILEPHQICTCIFKILGKEYLGNGYTPKSQVLILLCQGMSHPSSLVLFQGKSSHSV